MTIFEAQADETDTSARFPDKAVRVLRGNGLMGLLVPIECGGAGGDLNDHDQLEMRATA